MLNKILKTTLVLLFVLLIYSIYRFYDKQYINNEKPIIEEAKEVEEINEENYEATLYAFGDALIHGAVYYDARNSDNTYDFKYIFENIAPLLKKCDLCYYNQETILGGDELGFSSYPTFNTPQAFGENMIDLGFNLISSANNHSLDKGERGILNSIAFFEDKDVVNEGIYKSKEDRDNIEVEEINGITYTFLSYTYGTNGILLPKGKEYLVNIYNEEMIKEDVGRANEISDVVIVAMHWGTEYSFNINEEQESYTKLLLDSGADIIIGNHPHVIEPIKWIDGKPVIYALGNMISAQDGTERLIGAIYGIKISKKVINNEKSIELSQIGSELIYTKYDPGYKNFKLYFLDEVDDSILNNHEEIYNDFSSILTKEDSNIKIGGLK